MSKYYLHLLRINFYIIFGYLLITHNNQIDYQDQIEINELKIKDIKFKDNKDVQDIQKKAKAQPRIVYKCIGIDCIICDLYLIQIGFDYHQINLRQIFCDFLIDFNI